MARKKINLVIPVAGKAQRFLDKGYTSPKPMIMVKDQMMIDLAMSSIKYDECQLIFVVRKDHVYTFSIDKILKEKFGEDIIVLATDGITRGSICTVLLAEEYINNDNPLLIYTPDVFFKDQWDPSTIPLSTDGFILTFPANSPAHSYIQKDDKGRAIRTAEKIVISDEAAVGVYYFNNGKEFVECANEMIEAEDTFNDEFYICPVYNYIIKKGGIVRSEKVRQMHVLGTPHELEFYLKNVSPKFEDNKIALCADHSGFEAKNSLKKILDRNNIAYIDFGTHVEQSCDYSDFCHQAIHAIQNNTCDFGIGFCRTGQGMNITANKSKGIRGALIWDAYTAEMARRHNCANFFSIPSKYSSQGVLLNIIDSLRKNSFDGGRHMTRLTKAGAD